jgi:hypothetical protein
MNEKDFTNWLLAEIDRAYEDAQMATEQTWHDYHEGEFDAYHTALAVLRGEQASPLRGVK